MPSPPSSRPPESEAVINGDFLKLASAFFLFGLNLGMFSLVPYYLELRGEDTTMIGLAGGMLGYSSFLATLVLGVAADRVSRKKACLLYMLPMAASNLLAVAAFEGHPAWYLLALALQGVMTGAGIPMLFLWASEICPPARRPDVFAWFGIGGILSDTLGPFLGEIILNLHPQPASTAAYRGLFITANLLAPASMALLALTRNSAQEPGKDRAGFLPLLRHRESRLLLVCILTFGGILGVFLYLGKNYVAWRGLAYFSVVAAGHSAGALGSRLVFPWLRNRYGTPRLIPVAFAIMGASMLVFSQSAGYPGLFLSGTLYGIAHGLLFPSILSRFMDYHQPHQRGRASALMMGMVSLGTGLMPSAAGLLLHTLPFPTVLALLGATCFLALALSLLAEHQFLRRTESEG